MITLIVYTCLTAALTDCKEESRMTMPASATMIGCEQVVAVMRDPRIGPTTLGGYKDAKCVKC